MAIWLTSYTIVCAQPTTGQDSISVTTLTAIEVRTNVDLIDERAQCVRQFTNLVQLATAQNLALRQAGVTINQLRDTLQYNQGIYTNIGELETAMRGDLEKQLKKQSRKRKWNAIILYGVTGMAIAEAGYIIFRK